MLYLILLLLVVYQVTVPTPGLVCRLLFLAAAFCFFAFLLLRHLRRCVVGKAWLMFLFVVALVKPRHYFLAADDLLKKTGLL